MKDQSQYIPLKVNQTIFPNSSFWERLRLYPRTLTSSKLKIAFLVFLVPGLILLPVKAAYNFLRKSWDYASDFFAILTNLR